MRRFEGSSQEFRQRWQEAWEFMIFMSGGTRVGNFGSSCLLETEIEFEESVCAALQYFI